MRDLIEKIANRNERILLAINGLPLCGKSTLADGIASVIGGARITTSAALRALNNPMVTYQVDNAILVEDTIVYHALTEELKTKNDSFVIIDGCFRREGQTRSIIGKAYDLGFKIIAMDVWVSYPTIRERFVNRRRADDTLQKVTNRIREYQENQSRISWALTELTRYQLPINGDNQKEVVLQDALQNLGVCLQDHFDPICVFSRR